MKLYFKQRLFSWFDSYDIYSEAGDTVYTVEGQFSFGRCLHIRNADGEHIATLKQVPLSFLPTFELYEGDSVIGSVRKEFSFFKPSFSIDFRGWYAEGDFFEWDYTITDGAGKCVANIEKELFQLTDSYMIDVTDPADALHALMLVLAIDAEKDARN